MDMYTVVLLSNGDKKELYTLASATLPICFFSGMVRRRQCRQHEQQNVDRKKRNTVVVRAAWVPSHTEYTYTHSYT